MLYVHKKEATRIEQIANAAQSLTIRLIKIVGPYFLFCFFARWFFIMLGEDVKPHEIFENKALEFFKKLRSR